MNVIICEWISNEKCSTNYAYSDKNIFDIKLTEC